MAPDEALNLYCMTESVRGVDNNLLKLKTIGIISREGSDKSGLWKLNLIKF
jgi:hypothetical protein